MRRAHALAVVAIALTAVSGCGSPAESGHGAAKVATLTSAAPTKSADAGPPRPRERIDMTDAERDALMVAYEKCLTSHGVNMLDAKKARAGAANKSTPVDQAAEYCEAHYLPLPPWEKDPANPEARDFAVAVVKCLKAKGVKKVEVDADGTSIAFGGPENDAKSISMGLDLDPECEREVAAQKK
jgi:hypothetical protein